MPSQSQSLTAQGGTLSFSLQPGESAYYSASGTFTGFALLQRSRVGEAAWETVSTGAADTAISGTVKNETPNEERYRFYFKDTDAVTVVTGTLDTLFTDAPAPVVKVIVNAAGQAKVGGTAGFVVAAASNIALVTCPAGVTAGTLVVPLPRFKKGDIITGFHLIGQVESAANTVTVDADLRKHTTAAADVADASVGSITQLSVTADTIMGAANTRKANLYEVVGEDETFYVLVTATTGASTDIALQGVAVEIKEA